MCILTSDFYSTISSVAVVTGLVTCARDVIAVRKEWFCT